MIERKISFYPAYDKRNANPSKNYGIHGVDLVFSVSENGEGLTYTIFTNWMTRGVQEEVDSNRPSSTDPYFFHKPISAGCDLHSRTPRYEEQLPSRNCSITGGDCYVDGTSITDDLFYTLVEKGEEALWQTLEARFREWRKS